MKNEQIVSKYLITYYQFPKKLADRYADMLVKRWILRCINNELDSCTVSEDCYQETKDWETPDFMSEDVKHFVRMKLPFPNLDHSEKLLKKEIKQLFT